jgi:predicted negative regulator of RcsB-dependent stress response
MTIFYKQIGHFKPNTEYCILLKNVSYGSYLTWKYLDQLYLLQADEDSFLFNAIVQAATRNKQHIIIIPQHEQAIQQFTGTLLQDLHYSTRFL